MELVAKRNQETGKLESAIHYAGDDRDILNPYQVITHDSYFGAHEDEHIFPIENDQDSQMNDIMMAWKESMDTISKSPIFFHEAERDINFFSEQIRHYTVDIVYYKMSEELKSALYYLFYNLDSNINDKLHPDDSIYRRSDMVSHLYGSYMMKSIRDVILAATAHCRTIKDIECYLGTVVYNWWLSYVYNHISSYIYDYVYVGCNYRAFAIDENAMEIHEHVMDWVNQLFDIFKKLVFPSFPAAAYCLEITMFDLNQRCRMRNDYEAGAPYPLLNDYDDEDANPSEAKKANKKKNKFKRLK